MHSDSDLSELIPFWPTSEEGGVDDARRFNRFMITPSAGKEIDI